MDKKIYSRLDLIMYLISVFINENNEVKFTGYETDADLKTDVSYLSMNPYYGYALAYDDVEKYKQTMDLLSFFSVGLIDPEQFKRHIISRYDLTVDVCDSEKKDPEMLFAKAKIFHG